MKLNDVRYKDIGVHVLASIFTVDKGIIKVLLIRRNNEPYKDKWALIGGALYNNETVEDAMKREIKEKSGIDKLDLCFSSINSKVDRSPIKRMLAISFIGVLDKKSVDIHKETLKASDSDWFNIDSIPELAYDHNDIINECLETLREKIQTTDILKALFPNGFTIPEVQKTYETILNKEFDRRNFRKKLLSLGLISDTGNQVNFEGRKPAKLYKFNRKIKNKNVL